MHLTKREREKIDDRKKYDIEIEKNQSEFQRFSGLARLVHEATMLVVRFQAGSENTVMLVGGLLLVAAGIWWVSRFKK